MQLDDLAALSRELEKAGVTYEIEVYSGAPRAFTNWDETRYQRRVDELSWDAFSDFLATNLSE
jgi:dienelactone hydrolase